MCFKKVVDLKLFYLFKVPYAQLYGEEYFFLYLGNKGITLKLHLCFAINTEKEVDIILIVKVSKWYAIPIYTCMLSSLNNDRGILTNESKPTLYKLFVRVCSQTPEFGKQAQVGRYRPATNLTQLF